MQGDGRMSVYEVILLQDSTILFKAIETVERESLLRPQKGCNKVIRTSASSERDLTLLVFLILLQKQPSHSRIQPFAN